MQMPDYDLFFRDYVDFYNAALEGKPVIDDIAKPNMSSPLPPDG